MRLLLVTDTHGQLAGLDALARENAVDAVIHAGDFGFHDDASVDRLTDREVRIHIAHSDLNHSDKEVILGRKSGAQREFVRGHLPLSELPRFLTGEARFEIPVYAVWGNHEDVEVVRRFYHGEYRIDGLHLLHDQATFHLEGLHIFGLGGNFILGKKLFQTPIAGGGGKVWSVLCQYLRLLEMVRAHARAGENRILVSHVSPGTEAFITMMGIHTGSDLIVSGHMNPPFSMIWNDFAVRSLGEAATRVRERVADLQRSCESMGEGVKEQYEDALAGLADLPSENVPFGRRRHGPAWYVNMLNVNLPDASRGYCVLETDGDRWRIISRSIVRGDDGREGQSRRGRS